MTHTAEAVTPVPSSLSPVPSVWRKMEAMKAGVVGGGREGGTAGRKRTGDWE